jgi:ferredoxin-NADP reductase
MKARLERIELVTDSTRTFWFIPERRYRYLAGQYAELVLPHADMDARGDRRWFSFSSSPTEPLLGMTVKFHPEGSSFKQTLRALQPGSEVLLTDPLGDFVLPRDESIPLVFVAAGIGITPFRSMVQYLTDRNELRQIQLVYITRNPAGMAFLPLLTSYRGVELLPLHTQHNEAQYRPTVEDIFKKIGDTADKRIYLSGPQLLIEGLWTDMQNRGIHRDQLLLDYFPGYDLL